MNPITTEIYVDLEEAQLFYGLLTDALKRDEGRPDAERAAAYWRMRMQGLRDSAGQAVDELVERNKPTYSVSYWEERGEASLTLTAERENGENWEVFTLRNEELAVEIEAGYLVPPRTPRPRDEDWLEPALDYARSMGLL